MKAIIEDQLFYKEEHTDCFLYDSYEDPIISHVQKIKGETLQIKDAYNRVLFLLKGKMNFLYANNRCVLEEGMFVLLPRGCEYAMNIDEDISIVIVNAHHKINFCEHFPLEILHKLNKSLKNDNATIHPLKINNLLSIYLTNVVATISVGLRCKYFHDIKQRELFYYLRAFYPKDELAAFFTPILNEDTEFAELIYQNYESAKSLADLAEVTHYSLSGFKKRFIKVFGVAPYNWMEQEKAKKIHYDINCTQKPFKEIVVKYNFYSASHLNSFCKKMYGMSPAKLRKKTECAILNGNVEDGEKKSA